MPDNSAGLSRAREHFVAGRLEQARAILARILAGAPGDAHANAAMAHLHLLVNQRDRALYYAERAAAASPRESELLCELGKMFMHLERPDRAGEFLHAAVNADPGASQGRVSLASFHARARRYATAARVCRDGLGVFADHPDLANNLAHCLTSLGRAPESIEVLRRAIRANPDHLTLRSSLAMTLNYCPGVDARDILEAHADYGRTLRALAPGRPTPDGPADPERSLTVGFLSPDFIGHSVEYFIRPILTHLDRGRFRVVCFTASLDGAGTGDRAHRCDACVRAYGMNEEQFVRAFRDQGTDILIELSGHTDQNRLPSLGLRLAPVQGTYLGYPNTTGVPDVDVRFVDSLTDPSPTADAWATERLVRVDPCFLCYSPSPGSPPVGPTPCAAGGAPFTFGSFNTLSKVNDETIRLWVRVLDAVPGSRLLLKAGGLTEEEGRTDLASRFASAGLAPGRLVFASWSTDHAAHLSTYGRVDVALDPFPYNGTATTADAIWMGVPVVTLRGTLHAGRVGTSMLSAAGMPDLVAASPDEYVRRAAELAGDRAGLSARRTTMRERVARSTLCDGPAMGRRFGEALRGVWRDWCARHRS